MLIRNFISKGYAEFDDPEIYRLSEEFALAFKNIHANGYDVFLNTDKDDLGIVFKDELFRRRHNVDCQNIYGLQLNKYAINYILQKVGQERRDVRESVNYMMSLAKQLIYYEHYLLQSNLVKIDKNIHSMLANATNEDRHILRLSWYFVTKDNVMLRNHCDDNAFTFFTYSKGGELVLLENDGAEKKVRSHLTTVIPGSQLEEYSRIKPTQHLVRTTSAEDAKASRISVSTKFFI